MFKNNKTLLFASAIALVAIVGFFASQFSNTSEDTTENYKLRFAEAKSVWWNAPIILADEYGIYDKFNLNIIKFDVTTGLASKSAVVQGNADVGMVASTPLVTSALKDEDVIVLGSYLVSSKLLSLVSYKDTFEKWWDEPIGYVPGTISEFYLISYLREKGQEDLYSSKKLNLVKLAPPGILPVFAKRDIKSAFIWEPFSSMMKNKAEESVVVDTISDIYTLRLYLITNKDTWENNRDAVIAFVKAFDAISKEITNNSDNARKDVEKFFGYEQDSLKEKWGDIDYSFSTNARDILTTLEKEAQLAHMAGVVDTVPDFTKILSKLPEVAKQLR